MFHRYHGNHEEQYGLRNVVSGTSAFSSCGQFQYPRKRKNNRLFLPTFWISSTDLTRRQLKQKLKISSLLCCAFNFGFGYALLLLTRFTEDSNCKVLGELLVKMVKMVLQKTFKGAWKRNNKNHMIL